MSGPFYYVSDILYPDSILTIPYGISNRGEIVGAYSLASLTSSSFLLQGKTFTSIDAGSYTQANGVNDSGEIVGINKTSVRAPPQGWTYEDGKVTAFTVPEGAQTDPTSINDHGDIVGWYYGDVIAPGGTATPNTLGQYGFVYAKGQFYTFDVPNASDVSLLGINDRGQMVGSYSNSTGFHSFFYSDGTLSQIAVPNAVKTTVSGLNDFGEVVGSYSDQAGNTHGFIEFKGHYATVNLSTATTDLSLSGINDRGQLIGSYLSSTGVNGFVADPAYGRADHSTDTIQITPAAIDSGSSPPFLYGAVSKENTGSDTVKSADELFKTFHNDGILAGGLSFGPSEPLISVTGKGEAYFPGVMQGSAAFAQLSDVTSLYSGVGVTHQNSL